MAWCLLKMSSNVNVYNTNSADENEKQTKSEQAKFLERHAAEFGKRFGSSKAVNNGTTVYQSNFPPWMQTTDKKVHSGLGPIGSTFETDNLPPINVKLRWIREPWVPRNEGTEEAIQYAITKDIAIPLGDQLLPWDPRLCTKSYQFRDKIRRFMGCRQLGLNLQDLRLTFHNAVENFNYDQCAMRGSWDIFREYMSNPANSNFVFWVRLEPCLPFIKLGAVSV